MKLLITELLLHTCVPRAELFPKMEQLADCIHSIISSKYSLLKLKALDEFAKDSDLVRFVVDTLKAQPEMPSLVYRDYKACMMLIALSPKDFAFCYLSNDIASVCMSEYRTRELLFLCDLLHTLKERTYLDCVRNRVFAYFFRQRRYQLYKKPYCVREEELQYAESHAPELAEAVFRLQMSIYSYHTFVAEEVAKLCGMSYSLFRHHFKKYYGGVTATDWLRQRRISRIEWDMTSQPHFSMKEIAMRHAFPSASNFTYFCNRELNKTPTKWHEECYEVWEKKRMEYWNKD